MPKHVSKLGRLSLEKQLAACKVSLDLCSLKSSVILKIFLCLLTYKEAVKNGYPSLPSARQAELAAAISFGIFRHEKLFSVVVWQLETISHHLAASFKEYLRLHMCLYCKYPTPDETAEYM